MECPYESKGCFQNAIIRCKLHFGWNKWNLPSLIYKQHTFWGVSLLNPIVDRLSTRKPRHLFLAHCHLPHTPPTVSATRWRRSFSHICLLRFINIDTCILRNWHQSWFFRNGNVWCQYTWETFYLTAVH